MQTSVLIHMQNHYSFICFLVARGWDNTFIEEKVAHGQWAAERVERACRQVQGVPRAR